MPPRRARERTRLIGRVAELAALREAFSEARLVTLHGPPGVGKTRLALRFADALEREGRAVVFVELSEARSAADVAGAVAIAIDAALGPQSRAALEEVGEALSSRGEALLVLDEIEHAASHAEAAIFAWLDAAPGLSVLATSRERLAVPGERTLPVAPLPEAAAIELFVERARAARPSYDPAGTELAQAAALVERLDRLPLAIEIAAERASVLSAGELWRLIDEGALAIIDEPGRRDARRVTMRDAIAWSWALLDPAEQDAWAQCSVFRGGFDLAAAEAVIDLAAHPGAPPIAAVITALCRRSLLVRDEASDGRSRFYSYAVMTSFAAEKLGERAAAVSLRHARHYVAIAEDAARGAPYGTRREGLELLRRERENLLSAFRFGLTHAPSMALRAAAALDPLLVIHGPYETHIEVLTAALALPDEAGEPGARAEVLQGHWRIHALRGEPMTGEGALLEALAIARSTGDRAREADALGFLGYARRALGRVEDARADVLLARRIAQDLADPMREAAATRILGQIAALAGERREAALHFRASAALARRAGIPRLAAVALLNLADARREEGALADARAAQVEAAALIHEIDDQVHRVKGMVREGALLRAEGRAEEAEGELMRALSEAHRTRDAHTEAMAQIELAQRWLDAGDERAASRHLDDALAILRHRGDPALEARALRIAAWLAPDAAAGQREAARALSAAQRAADQRAVLEARATSALIAAARTAPADARAALAAIAGELGPDASPRLAAIVLAHLALIEALLGDPGAARDAIDRARAALDAIDDAEARAVVDHASGAIAKEPPSSEPRRWASVARIERLAARAAPRALVIDADGRAFTLASTRVDLGRRGALRRILAALAEQRVMRPGVGLPVRDLVRAGWPGEKMTPESATSRTYMAVRALRAMGLEGLLLTRDDGYLLDPAAPVEISPRFEGPRAREI